MKFCIDDFLRFFLCVMTGFFALNAQAQNLDLSHDGMMNSSGGMWGLGLSGWITLIIVIGIFVLMAIWLFKKRK